MADDRQETFKKLRSPCVELSSRGLRFKAKQATVKDVLHALQDQNNTLQELGNQNRLDPKLAEYAFFPLTHIFNEAQRLSSRCLEIAIDSVNILITHGWRNQLGPEMGKQLLILMTLIAGNDPRRQLTVPTNELKVEGFKCIACVFRWLPTTSTDKLDVDESIRHIIDQLVYLLTEAMSDINDIVQISASSALNEIFKSLSSRVFLASILPRTVSSAVKALRPNSNARRPYKALCCNLVLVQTVLRKVLSDDGLIGAMQHDKEVLDGPWLKATSAQVRNALIQIVKSRSHERLEVRNALADLCLMVLEDCYQSLPECLPIMLETLLVLCGADTTSPRSGSFEQVLNSRSELMDMVRSNFYDWTQSFPRIMQANSNILKTHSVQKIAYAYDLITKFTESSDSLVGALTSTLIRGVTATFAQNENSNPRVQDLAVDSYLAIAAAPESEVHSFEPVLFEGQSQQALAMRLQAWMMDLRTRTSFGDISRGFVDAVASSDGDQKLAALWLATRSLSGDQSATFDFEDLIVTDSFDDRSTLRSYLVHDLYSSTKSLLIDSSPYSEEQQDWRLTALSLEALVLQAQQLAKAYRNELSDTLYPVLALFGSQNGTVRNHAFTALNLVASACEYKSTKDMLMENTDYLVNSVAWKLNTFNLSPEAPQVLNMVVRLAGARILPYIDDLISSIFTALDNFHGYPAWVELLFSVLKTIVEESAKEPLLAIAAAQGDQPAHQRMSYKPWTVGTIVDSLRARKKRKLTQTREDTREGEAHAAPRRPWHRGQDDETHKSAAEATDISLEDLLKQDEEADLPGPATKTDDEDPMTPLSKSHDLLLKIAQATVPHLSSPSPRVRQLLLQLLLQISPILARHENTFLPLINAVWPAIVPRLFAEHTQLVNNTSEGGYSDSTAGEMPYNIITAACLVATLCQDAGSFMSSRIEQIMGQLTKLFRQTFSDVGHTSRGKVTDTENVQQQRHSRIAIQGVVSLGIVRQAALSASSAIDSFPATTSESALTPGRTSQWQVLESLVTLFTSILTHVSIQAHSADQIIDCLIPLLKRLEDQTAQQTPEHPHQKADRQLNPTAADKIRKAIEIFNPDILWLVDHTREDPERKVEME